MKGYGGSYHQTVSVYPRPEHAFRTKRPYDAGLASASNPPDDADRGPPPRAASPAKRSDLPARPRDLGNDIVSVGLSNPGQQQHHQSRIAHVAPGKHLASSGAAAPSLGVKARAADDKGGGAGLEAVQMSLQDMLAAAARIQNELLASTSSRASLEAQQPLPHMVSAPGLVAQRTSQSRGPLEALRDELFGSLSEPTPPTATAATIALQPAVPHAEMLAMPASSPPRMGRTASGSVDAASYSPATENGGPAQLQEETSTMTILTAQAGHSYADLSSICSIPDSTFNAVARTPMSFTTAAVSELDTPSSMRSRDEEYDKSFASPNSSPERDPAGEASGGRPGAAPRHEYNGISSGYDDYVSPASWMSLREQHGSARVNATSTESGPRRTDGCRAAGGGMSTSTTPTGPVVAHPGRAIDLLASASAVALPPPPPVSPVPLVTSAPHAAADVDNGSRAAVGANTPLHRLQDAAQNRHQEQRPRQVPEEQEQHQRPPWGSSRPDIVALAPPQLSLEGVGSHGPPPLGGSASSPSSSSPPTGFGSIVLNDSSRSRDRPSSGHLFRSLSFGIPSAASAAPSGVSSGNGGEEGWSAGETQPAGHESSLGFASGVRRPTGTPEADAAAAPARPMDTQAGVSSPDDDAARGRYAGMTFTNPLYGVESSDSSGGAAAGSSGGGGGSCVDGELCGVVQSCAGSICVAATPPPTAREGVATVPDEQEVQSSSRVTIEEEEGEEEEMEEGGEEEEEQQGEDGQRQSRAGSDIMAASAGEVAAALMSGGHAADPRRLDFTNISPGIRESASGSTTSSDTAMQLQCGSQPVPGPAESSKSGPRLTRTYSGSASASRAGGKGVEAAASAAAAVPGDVTTAFYASSAAEAETEGTDQIQPLALARSPSLTSALAPVSPPVGARSTATAAGAAATLSPGPSAELAAAATSRSEQVSATVLGAVPEQDRGELVRSWAQVRADFGARPQGSDSCCGGGSSSALTPEASHDGSGAAAAAVYGRASTSSIKDPAAGAGLEDPSRLRPAQHPPVPIAPGSGAGDLAGAAAAATSTAAGTDAGARASGHVRPYLGASKAVSVRAMTAAAGAVSSSFGPPAVQPAATSAAGGPAALQAAAVLANLEAGAGPGNPLVQLLSQSLLSARGARSEGHGQGLLLTDTLRSAVFDALALPRPNSAPVLVLEADAAGNAAGGAAPPCSAVAIPTDCSHCAVAGDAHSHVAAAVCSRLPVRSAVGSRLLEQPHPHLQPHLPLHPQPSSQQQQQQPVPQLGAGPGARPPAAPGPVPPVTQGAARRLKSISPSGSMGSIDSEVATERLKAKMRAYLQAAEAGGGSAGFESASGTSSTSALAAATTYVAGVMKRQQLEVAVAAGSQAADAARDGPAVRDAAANAPAVSNAAVATVAAAELPFLSATGLDSLLQQATRHLQAVSDPAAAAAGAAQPSLLALEEILRQLRTLTRSSGGGALVPTAAAPPPLWAPMAPARDLAGAGGSGSLWARKGYRGSGGGGASSVSGGDADSISVYGFLEGGGGGGARGGGSGGGGGLSGGQGVERASAEHRRMSSSVGSVSLWAASTGTGSSALGAPSRGSRSTSSPSRLGPEEAAVAAAAAAKSAAAAAAAANAMDLRLFVSPRASAAWAASGDQHLPSPHVIGARPVQPPHSPRHAMSPRTSHQLPYPYTYDDPTEGKEKHGAALAGAQQRRGSKPEGSYRSRGATSPRLPPPAEFSQSYPSFQAAPEARGVEAPDAGSSYLDMAAHADLLRKQLGVEPRVNVSPRQTQRQEGCQAAVSGRAGGGGREGLQRQGGDAKSSSRSPRLNNRAHGDTEQTQRQQQPVSSRRHLVVSPPPQQGSSHAPGLEAPPVDWQAALRSKLLPYDAVRTRDSLIDASTALAGELPARWTFVAVTPPPPPQASGAPHGSKGGPGSRNTSAVRQSRPPSPDARPTSARPGSGSAAVAARSAPVTPRRGNSPGRSPAAGTAAAHGAAAGNLSSMPSKSPRAGSANPRNGRGGSGSSASILDRATPRGAGAGGGGSNGSGVGGRGAGGGGVSPPRPRSPSAAPATPEPISIVRPFAWQERETRNWLEDMGLIVTSTEESLPLLDNPLRNGLLLVALAARVVSAPLPAGVVTEPPRDVRSARTNILCALDHLGMLAAPWAPPSDAERRARAHAAAPDFVGAATAGSSGGGGGGLGPGPSGSRSPSPAHNNSSGPTAGSSGIIMIKALGSAGRGYALRLKERQLRAGLGLVAEVESVLAGSVDSIWGLLNFIRLAVAPQYRYLRGGGGSTAGVAGPRRAWAAGGAGGEEANGARRSFDVRGGAGPDGTVGLGPAPAALAAAAVAAAGSGGLPTNRSGKGGDAGTQAGAESGGQLARPWSAEPTPALRGGGRVSLANNRGRVLVSGGPIADPRGSVQFAAPVSQGAPTAAAPAAGGGSAAAAAGAGAAATESGLLYRPLWPQLASLPYSPVEVAALESSLLQWLTESGAISRREAAQGFSALLPMFEDGTFICWLVSNLSGKPIVGAHRRPLTEAACRTNWLKAIDALRTMPGMSRRFLVFEEALIHVERPPLTGLLEDLHRLAGGLPPAPSAVLADAKPYLPYVVPEPHVRTLPPDRIALNRGSPAASPLRASPPGRTAAATATIAQPRAAAGARVRRSTPSASSSPCATPIRHRSRQGGDGAAVEVAAAVPAAAPHQQHPLFQKAVPTAPPPGHLAFEQDGGDVEDTTDDGGPRPASARDGGGSPNARPATVAATSGVRRAAAVDFCGSCGGGPSPRGALITDMMVSPTKILPSAPKHRQDGASDQRRRRRPVSTSAFDLLRAYPVAVWGIGPDAAATLLPHPEAAQAQQAPRHFTLTSQFSQRVSLRGSRSAGGALEGGHAGVASPAQSPRLRLVPSGA